MLFIKIYGIPSSISGEELSKLKQEIANQCASVEELGLSSSSVAIEAVNCLSDHVRDTLVAECVYVDKHINLSEGSDLKIRLCYLISALLEEWSRAQRTGDSPRYRTAIVFLKNEAWGFCSNFYVSRRRKR